MNLKDVLLVLVNRLPAPQDDDERLREAEKRINALDATIGAQQAQRTKERHRRDGEESRRVTQ